VYLSGAFSFVCSAATISTIAAIQITEISNGVDPVFMEGQSIPATQTARVYSVGITPVRLAASTARVRQFKLQAVSYAGVVFDVSNGANARSYLAAEAR
jgi:hypothetical protein